MIKKLSLMLALVVALGMVMVGCSSDNDGNGDGDDIVSDEPTMVVASEDFGDEFYGVGFRKEDVSFGNKLNEALNALIENGEAGEISTTWFGSDIVYRPDTPTGDIPTEDTSWEDILERGYFVLGLDDEFPPMGYRDDSGEIMGFDIDLAKAVGEYLDVEVRIQPISWNTKELELSSKAIDVIWNGFTMTDERVNALGFTQPYLENRQVIVSMSDRGIDTKADLAGRKVGVQLDSSGQNAVESDEATLDTFDDELIKYETYLDALLELKTGAVDAVVGDEILLRYMIAVDAAK